MWQAALQFVVSRGVDVAMRSPLVRVYLSEVVSEFEPIRGSRRRDSSPVDLHAGAGSGACRRSRCICGSTPSSRPVSVPRRNWPSSQRVLGIPKRRNWLYIKSSSRSWSVTQRLPSAFNTRCRRGVAAVCSMASRGCYPTTTPSPRSASTPSPRRRRDASSVTQNAGLRARRLVRPAETTRTTIAEGAARPVPAVRRAAHQPRRARPLTW